MLFGAKPLPELMPTKFILQQSPNPMQQNYVGWLISPEGCVSLLKQMQSNLQNFVR